MAGFNEVGKSAVAELVSVIAVVGTLNGGTPIVAFDPAASEQVTRAMRSSVVMRALVRVRYSLPGGGQAYSAWTPIGETVRVPRGAAYIEAEYDGEVIDGGPWLVPGGELRS